MERGRPAVSGDDAAGPTRGLPAQHHTAQQYTAKSLPLHIDHQHRRRKRRNASRTAEATSSQLGETDWPASWPSAADFQARARCPAKRQRVVCRQQSHKANQRQTVSCPHTALASHSCMCRVLVGKSRTRMVDLHETQHLACPSTGTQKLFRRQEVKSRRTARSTT